MNLTTKRLILRDFEADDWAEAFAYQSDPRYLRFYEWDQRTPDEVQEFVGTFIAQQHQRPRTKFQLAIVLRQTDELIGNCGIRLEAPESHQADIGYELSPHHWGNGYATEAARALLKFGFTELSLHRIWSWCIADNIASAHVLQRLGMRLEGRLRQNEYFKGRWWDTLLYGILDFEWHAQRHPPTPPSGP